MTIKEMQRILAQTLTPAVGEGEAQAMASIIIEDVKGYKPIDIAINGHRQLLPETEQRMLGIARRVVDGEPLQYVLGTTQFRGRYFTVSPAVLIPRPETAQLVDLIVKQYGTMRDCRVLDVGTGSGCIAVSLALDLPFAQVTGIDISPAALDVALNNAKALKAKVEYLCADALRLAASPLAGRQWDVIVSNPPYVMDSERPGMERRVTHHEPATALFVPDDDPLVFYRAIADYAIDALADGGRLYIEINPLCANALHKMLTANGYDTVDILADYKSTSRFAIATKR